MSHVVHREVGGGHSLKDLFLGFFLAQQFTL